MVFVFGLVSAVLLAVGFVVQQHVAALTPAEERLSPRLLLDLIGRPLWLVGIASMAAGQIVEAVALHFGDLTVVEALTATNVLFALPMAAAWRRKRLCRLDWVGAAGIVAGLATFVIAADPPATRIPVVPFGSWLAAGLAILAAAAVVVAVGRRRSAAPQATLFGLGAGIVFGLQDGLTQRVLQVPFGIHFLTSWVPYALLGVGITGLLIAQSAYQAAPLKASLPAINIAEPVTGIGLGAGLFAQGLRVGTEPLIFELLGIVCMMVGLLLVARSDVVTGHHPRLHLPARVVEARAPAGRHVPHVAHPPRRRRGPAARGRSGWR